MSDNARTRPYITTRATIQGKDGILSYVCEPKHINGVPFNLSVDITVPAQGSTLTDLVPIELGGTGATTIEDAQTALELEPGADIQPYATNLDAWSGIAHAYLVDVWIETPSAVNLYNALSNYDGNSVSGDGGGVVFKASPTIDDPILENPYVSGDAFSTVPASAEGRLRYVTDSATDVPGDIITGSGSKHVLGYYNGTNWVVAAGAKPTVKSIFFIPLGNTQQFADGFSANVPWYASSASGVNFTAEDQNLMVMPYACTLRSLSVRSGDMAKTATPVTTCTVRKNKSDTALTLTLTQTVTTTSSDSTHSVSFAAGDLFDVYVNTTGTGAASVSMVGISLEVDQA